MPIRFLTAGESHGKALIGIIEGVPAGLNLNAEEIVQELIRRKSGFGRSERQLIETEKVEIISGVRFGKTLGSPISIMIKNDDYKNWTNIMQVEPTNIKAQEVVVPRPGHADYIGGIKYDHKDLRNVLERASARETAIRVALGSVAKKLLSELGIQVTSRVVQIGIVRDQSIYNDSYKTLNEQVDKSKVRVLDEEAEIEMIAEINRAKEKGDSLGGAFEVYAEGVPKGLGSYTHWDQKLDGKIAQSFMSLNAIKAVEIGIGSISAEMTGSQCHDQLIKDQEEIIFKSNSAGGILGGMSSGEPIVVRAFMKPIATLLNPLNSVNIQTGVPEKAHVERSDICAVPAASVISESLLALTLANEILIKFGGDSVKEIKERVEKWNQK